MTYNGKSGNWQFLLSHCRYLDFFLQKSFLSSPLRFIWILSKSLNLIGCHGNIKDKFSKNYSKIFSSEAIRGMKVKLSIHVHDISLYINCVFIVAARVVSLAFISVFLQIIWQKFYRNVPGVVLYQPYEFCENRWLWLVAMPTERLSFREKKYSKIFFSEVIRGGGWSWNFA